MDCFVTLAGIEYNGKPSLMNVIQDLTDQRRQQREVLYLKDRADFMIEKNPALMFVFDPDLNVTKQTRHGQMPVDFQRTVTLDEFHRFCRRGPRRRFSKRCLKIREETSGNVTSKHLKGSASAVFLCAII